MYSTLAFKSQVFFNLYTLVLKEKNFSLKMLAQALQLFGKGIKKRYIYTSLQSSGVFRSIYSLNSLKNKEIKLWKEEIRMIREVK